ncbi:MAG: SH3 domain-containing protein [Chloroflexi bacterium]|nr:SH3 domain-containing protein [Chloroflexota bacterium]
MQTSVTARGRIYFLPNRSIGAACILCLIALLALTLTACNSAEDSPQPQAAPFATPETLPTLPVRNTRQAVQRVQASELTATPTRAATRSAESTTQGARATAVSGRLPSGYVQASSAPLLDAPGGAIQRSLPAGTRVGILDREGGWLHVRFLADQDEEPTTGWMQLSQLVVFGDLDKLSADTAPTPIEVTPTPGSTELIESESTITALVLPRRLNLRAGPGTDTRVIGSLSSGEEVYLLGRTENSTWLEIATGQSEQGWVAARYLETSADIESLPITGVASTIVPAAQSASAEGKIVFQTRNGGDIYIIGANGTGLRRLTRGFDPALSPDGKQVAFTRWDEPRGLWLIDADGTGERHLHTANKPRSPTWTPDGSAIVFERSTGTINCISTPFGCRSREELRDSFGGQDCIDTPFGRFCISDFPAVTRSLGGLLRYNLGDGSVRDLPTGNDASSPSHDPSSDRVVFLEREGLAFTRSSGNEPPQPLVKLSTLGPAIYSPDGQFLYTTRRSGDHWDIWRHNADGSGEFALTAPPGIRDAPVHSVAPTLSPDGKTILFSTNRRGSWELWQMNTDGSRARPFAPAALSGIEIKYDFANERMADWGR